MIATLLIAAAAAATPAPAKRCGWLVNPTPGNWWLIDRAGEWELGVQGGYQAPGMDTMPDMSTRGWVETNGSYGHGCACMTVTTDARTRRITRVIRATPCRWPPAAPIAACRSPDAMPTRTLFPTHFYEGALGDEALLGELADACRELASEDRAGRAWSKAHGYRGYTSYASLDDLPQRDPRFEDLVRHLNRHVAAFARDCGFELGKRLKLDSLWVNVLKPGGTHSGHIHPHSAVSGTLYVAVPPGSGALKLEDPRLPMLMAAPARPDTFVYAEPAAGSVFLWESWLRHEVMPNAGKGERISISFNYR